MFEDTAVTSEMMLIVPAVVGGVALLVGLVFWLGSGRQRSFEEEKALASKRADEALREREKAQQGGKKKRQFVRKKAAARGSGGEEEESASGNKGRETPEPAPKPILKGSGGRSPAAASVASPLTTSPERTPLKVDFQLEEMTTPKPSEKKAPLVRMATPHPSTLKQKAALARRLVEEEEEEEDSDLGGKPVMIKDESPTLEDEPRPKPSAARQTAPKPSPSTSKASAGTGGGQKKRKAKQTTAPGESRSYVLVVNWKHP